MYEQIREHIRENEIPEALDAMDKLPLSGELKGKLLTLHRRWRIYEDKAMSNLEEERLLRIEENQIVNDLVLLLDRAENPRTTRQREVKVTYTERDAGASAGAKTVEKSRGFPMSYLLGALGLVALLAFGWWAMQSSPDPGMAEVTTAEVQEEQAPSPAVEERPAEPTPSTTPEEDKPQTPATRVPVTTTIRDHRLTEAETKVLQVDPTILRQNTRITDALKNSIAMMTDGAYVPMAVAVYYNENSPTKYNEQLTRSLGSFLRTRIQREMSMTVLTNAFHQSDMREKMVLRGTGGDSRIKQSRTKHLMLCDIRQVSGDKGYLRMCLYDVERQKGFTRGKSITIRSGSSFQEKEMLYAVNAYLKELKERGLFE